MGETPLIEMWRGERISRLREAVAADDLSYACSRCAEEIAGGNLSGSLAVGFDQFADPLKVVLHRRGGTGRCGLFGHEKKDA